MTETTDPATAPSTPAWKRVLTIVIPLLILALALHGLANEFDENGYRAIRHAFHQLSGTQIALTVVLGLASYACLIGFDAIGLRRSGIRVHPARIGITAFLAHTLGQTVGFAALTGGAVRLRGYRTAGLDLAQIGQVVLMSTLGFVFGAWLLISVALCMEPAAAALALPLDPDAVRVVGIVALLAYAATLLLVGRDGRQFSVFGHVLWLPDRRTMIGVTVLSVIELVLASAAFYVLLPDSTPTGLPGFVGLYLVAVLAGLVSTVPAGLGVFEWSLLKLLPQVAPAAVLAAALIYRVTYYVLPLLLATLLALAPALRQPLQASAGATRAGWNALRPWLPQIIALAVFSIGAALVIDGTLPTPRRHLVNASLPILETSHLIGSLSGVALLLIGQGLARRSHAAWMLAMAVCVITPLPLWLRGGQPLIAVSALLVAMALWAARREFYRQGALLDEAWSWPWLRNLGLVLVAVTWLLFFTYSHVEYQNELWWQFAISGNAPRALRALLVVAIALVMFGLARLLHSTRSPLPAADEATLQSLAPVLAGATDTQACLVLTADKAVLRDDAKQGFVMMQRYGGSLIAMGDPVGPPDVARALIWRFREEADRLGLRPVFYQVGETYWQTYLDLGLGLVKLGEEAIVPLHDFSLEGRERADLRQAWNRGKRGGLSFRVAPVEEIPSLLPRLHAISNAWLEDKAGDEKGFSLGSYDPDYLARFPVALVEAEGQIVAFANLWQAPAGAELSVDLMRHVNEAPKGTMDFLFIELFLWGRAQGYARFSLGMAPLSGLAQHRLAGRWNRLAGLLARHGERFYGFSGLRRFKSKFDPQWRPRYLAAPGGMHLPAALLDATRLISLDPRRN
ncbi:bifunctional lysylphosphatidylglycerol flippase/synthetase MprF [Stenotrophomonas maltophilia]|uniref:bifunctional lysylphosphatidylglycerol flippase/synthetase MprF n=1 Tax=Stenotrophomonas maltophilia TaxID=40324 RepID=UPI002A9A7A9E|nr:bifunctional lysylphosphatidylglycerol flippase/synthetase MprF [Stenotrophomonas maltophilia]MDZ5790893.1 bifunctional lysylphosphatidylglycerol flippase/synthetase MprF [Stenotrophomonas maltophilia]HEL5573028.1 bifunctional lysylphosphatidylglycerol flippase/synthetase MprF [Stenotrophomonas maltophilia]